MVANFSSISPIDGISVWSGSESIASEIDETMIRATAASHRWRRTPLARRIEVVRNYRDSLESGRSEIQTLITREVGKLPWDAAGEVNVSIAKIERSIQALQQRRSPLQLDPSPPESPIRRRIEYQPLGAIVVLGPFNFPLHLPGGQIIPALLAGNSVVFKPSEQATAIGCWMADAWRSAGLPDDVLRLIVGGPDVAARAIESPLTRAVFLTGSRAVGRAIHRQLAGRPGVLLALELGGNNPIVITEDVRPQTVASIVSASAFISAGQRCTCARRAIFVDSASANAQLDSVVRQTDQLRVGMPDDSPVPHIGPVISESAAAGLRATYDKLLSLGCQPIIDWKVDRRAENLVRPAMVDATSLSQVQLTTLGEMEWFGPLLVVQRAKDFDDAIKLAANTPYGLAAALLGGNSNMFERFAAEVHAGVVNWNGTTTGAAGTLPFGGLGDSGNHRPAGFYAIDFCSDPIAILHSADPPTDDPWSVVK